MLFINLISTIHTKYTKLFISRQRPASPREAGAAATAAGVFESVSVLDHVLDFVFVIVFVLVFVLVLVIGFFGFCWVMLGLVWLLRSPALPSSTRPT